MSEPTRTSSLSPIQRALLERSSHECRPEVPDGKPANPWLVRGAVKPRASHRVLLFPHAGGGSATFRGWHAHFGEEVETWVIRLPGRETRSAEPLSRDLLAVADAVAEAVASSIAPPYSFFGHSMGALLAFEVVRALRRARRAEPRHLFVASYCAPDTQSPGNVRRHESEEQILERLMLGNSLDREMARELFATLRPILSADVALCESYAYTPGPRLDCPITAYRGARDYVSEQDTQGWARETRGSFERRTFSGDHFFIAHHAATLAACISTTIVSHTALAKPGKAS